MRHQLAWLELHAGIWYLITDIKSETVSSSRKWLDKAEAILDLTGEGWTISGPYPNWLTKKLYLGDKYRGYGLIRTIH